MWNQAKSSWRVLVVCGLAAAASAVAAAQYSQTRSPDRSDAAQRVMPRYAKDGALMLPDDHRRWIFIGSSLGLSYSEGGSSGMEMFHETLMEPTAYKHYVDTGTFREGTMFVLLLHGVGQNVMPARQGRFATEVHGVEMAVKDSSHRPEAWAYYNFGGMMGGMRTTAQANPKAACYNCHLEHAKRDNVFVQFYSMLPEPARSGGRQHP